MPLNHEPDFRNLTKEQSSMMASTLLRRTLISGNLPVIQFLLEELKESPDDAKETLEKAYELMYSLSRNYAMLGEKQERRLPAPSKHALGAAREVYDGAEHPGKSAPQGING